MSLNVAVYSMVTGDGTLAGLVGTRVYPLQYPADATFPCITYRIISGYQQPHTGNKALYIARVQFDIWDYHYDDVITIKEALLVLFNQKNTTVANQAVIIHTIPDLMFDIFEGETKLHRGIVDIRVSYELT